MLYFAYGSNLSCAQMGRRCPSARTVGRATLKGWRLTFTGYSSGWGGATATIVRDKDAEVTGVVYELWTQEDVKRLDAFEGFPTVHECRELKVRIEGRAERVKAWAYIKLATVVGAPSEAYFKTIAGGLKEHHHGTDALRAAVARAVNEEAVREKRAPIWPPKPREEKPKEKAAWSWPTTARPMTAEEADADAAKRKAAWDARKKEYADKERAKAKERAARATFAPKTGETRPRFWREDEAREKNENEAGVQRALGGLGPSGIAW